MRLKGRRECAGRWVLVDKRRKQLIVEVGTDGICRGAHYYDPFKRVGAPAKRWSGCRWYTATTTVSMREL